VLELADGAAPPRAPVAVSIRPQSIAIKASGANRAAHERGPNVREGRIVRHVYLGESRDYQVEVLGTDVVLRVATGASQKLRTGEPVWLAIDPAACRVIAG
jgi:ABC-type Fe3+/spermidine/putrescine transport system ATPase subunit